MTSTMLTSSGVILLTVIAVAWGGTFLVRVTTGGHPVNDLQRSFFRAGHAHAGVLIILGLVVRLMLVDPRVPAWASVLSDGILFAAILMPAGFSLSVIGQEPERPNALRTLIWLGAASLIIGLLAAGVGLIVAGVSG